MGNMRWLYMDFKRALEEKIPGHLTHKLLCFNAWKYDMAVSWVVLTLQAQTVLFKYWVGEVIYLNTVMDDASRNNFLYLSSQILGDFNLNSIWTVQSLTFSAISDPLDVTSLGMHPRSSWKPLKTIKDNICQPCIVMLAKALMVITRAEVIPTRDTLQGIIRG